MIDVANPQPVANDDAVAVSHGLDVWARVRAFFGADLFSLPSQMAVLPIPPLPGPDDGTALGPQGDVQRMRHEAGVAAHDAFARALAAWRNQDPAARAAAILFTRYLRGADYRMRPEEFYAEDRYNQANMGLPYLAGWEDATDQRKQTFADYLAPMDREALADSLVRIAQASRDAGDLYTAETAQDMAVYLQSRFAAQLAALPAAGPVRDAGTADAARLACPPHKGTPSTPCRPPFSG